MISRLSAEEHGRLQPLRSRRRDDPSIALLDAWSVVSDVLTFYQERIANEAYLRTASERRSLIEIARLVGYRPRPGVAATTHLAFSLENESDPATIAEGTRVNSIPGPGEKMVAFETSEPIAARREWNIIEPRLARPQTTEDLANNGGLYVKGIKTKLKPSSPLLLRKGKDPPELKFVLKLIEDPDMDRTLVVFDTPATKSSGPTTPPVASSVYGLPIAMLGRPSAVPPASSAALARSVELSFAKSADTLPRLLNSVQPALGKTLYRALRNLPPPDPEPIRLYALRVDARPFGHNAPLKLTGMEGHSPILADWETAQDSGTSQAHKPTEIYLDNDYDILPDSMVAIVRADGKDAIYLGTPEKRKKEKLSFNHVSLNAYGMSGKSVHISWDVDAARPWLEEGDEFKIVRTTRVFAGSEELELADAPIPDDIAGQEIELGRIYDGLEPGRWLIIEGERSDIVDASQRIVPGIRAAELVMLQGVEQSVRPFPTPPVLTGMALAAAAPATAGPEQKLRTIIKLAAVANGDQKLAYSYKRDTVRIYANVARATHGETRAEVLGNGDAAASLQAFAIKQPPLTHVTAATTTGTKSTLEVRVNDLLWREASSLAGLGPNDRGYVTRDDDEGVTSVIFGNGMRGARTPTGRENVKAAYRNGIGRSGNVPAGRLTLLATRPLGAKEVINPLPATGGADRESLQSIRRNAPIALMALDRLVSTSDYANFARAFGGIGKANSVRVSGQDVAVAVAGVDDSPIAAGSELLRNLEDAMRSFGDPQVVVKVIPRKRLVLLIQANVLIEPDRQWTIIEPKIRAALLDEFGFDRIELGEWLTLARALKAIQAVEGVVFADVDIFDRLDEQAILARITGTTGTPGTAGATGTTGKYARNDLIKVAPDEIAYLTPDVPDTLILQELKS